MKYASTWPISRRQIGPWVCFGIPDRLGDERSLEVVGRDDWMCSVLGQLLPRDQTWMWWTRSKIYRQGKIPTTRAKARVDSQTLTGAVARQFRLSGMTAAFLPPDAEQARGSCAYWSGIDSDIPEHIWAARSPSVVWDVAQVARWCTERDQWTDPNSLPADVVGCAAMLFDGQISFAVPRAEVVRVNRTLELNAGRWRLRMVAGPPEHAWSALLRR